MLHTGGPAMMVMFSGIGGRDVVALMLTKGMNGKSYCYGDKEKKIGLQILCNYTVTEQDISVIRCT